MSIFIPEGELWESDKIKKIYSLEHHIETMQKVEAALARAEADLGIIPREAADEINAKATIDYVEVGTYEKQMVVTGGHPIVSMLRAWQPSFKGSGNAEYIHWGATTQDIMDTADVLRLREVYDVIYGELKEIQGILISLSEKYIDVPIAGRTHGQHAVPITFGLKIAVWLMEVNRHLQRMEDCKKRLFAASFYGAAGNLASLTQGGLEITKKMAEYLDLVYIPVPWHTSRDNFAEFMTLLVIISSTFGKIGSELYELSRTEVGEVEEPWTYGNVGSSTMPQKRNPPGCEAMVSLAKISQFEVGAIYEAMNFEDERDSRAWNIEKFVFPMTCSMTEKNLAYAILILKDLVVYPKRMRANLELTNGLIMSESIMMTLGGKIGRLHAHEKVYAMAMEAYKTNRHLKDLILADKDIMAKFTKEEIDACFDPVSYVGDAYKMVKAAIELSK